MSNSGITLRLQLFNTGSDRTNVGQRWGMWLEESEDELHLQRATDDNEKIIFFKDTVEEKLGWQSNIYRARNNIELRLMKKWKEN